MKYIQFKEDDKTVWFDHALYTALTPSKQETLRRKLLDAASNGRWIATIDTNDVSFSKTPKVQIPQRPLGPLGLSSVLDWLE